MDTELLSAKSEDLTLLGAGNTMRMDEEPPEIEARSRRLRAYIHHNGDQMVVDLSVIFAWILTSWTIFGFLRWPGWLLYIVLFTGIIVYSRVTPTWERPYRSPDLDAASEE